MKNDIPNASEMNDPLDELLRGADEYLPDNGFTARVLTALPERRKHSWRRFVVLTAAMIIGAVLVAWQMPASIALVSMMPRQWSAIQWPMLLALVPTLVALASLGWMVFLVTNEEE
jgi:uncharacterized membrane protein YcjF (UPF0283 family)